MKRIVATFLPVLLLAANAVSAMDEESSMKREAECRKYAVEDSISPEDMDAYMEDCVRDLAEATDTSDPSSSGESENQE